MNTVQAPIQSPVQPSSEWDEARTWFNNMETNSRNHLIMTMYRLCMSTKEISHKKLAESLNSQWGEKYSLKDNEVKQLQMQNTVLQQNQQQHVGLLTETVRQLESRINDSVNSIALKITPSSNGKLGENYIEDLLGKIPNTELINVSQYRGGGDFMYTQGNVNVMIESKNWTDSSIKGNPKELTNFRNTAIKAKEEEKIDYAIMALHRVTNMKGKGISMETLYTKKGRLMLIYVTNLFNHPERLLYAVDAGMLLLQQQDRSEIDSDKFLYQVDHFTKSIEQMEDSIKERTKLIKSLMSLVKRDTDEAIKLRNSLENIVNDTDQIPLKDRVINLCWDLILKNNKNANKVTKGSLEQHLLQNKIPAMHVRNMGGIKVIKNLAIEKFKENTDEQTELTNEQEILRFEQKVTEKNL